MKIYNQSDLMRRDTNRVSKKNADELSSVSEVLNNFI